MLMNRIRETYREVTGNIAPVTTIASVSDQLPAANADRFTSVDMLARRQRRQRRSQVTGSSNLNSWSVRSW